jgi:dTDP-4-dehydrorhamnose reductase
VSLAAGKVLITGAGGQLGRELQSTAPGGWAVVPCTSTELDITDQQTVNRVLTDISPSVVINTAAFTRVDDAEREVSRARAVNAEGAANVAHAAQRIGARLIHISTDFVFDGTQGRPYAHDDPPNPLGVYGRTKWAGEQLVLERTGGAALIVRTAWVYAARGQNFVRTMLRLMREREVVDVVDDQVGTPTWARSVALALWKAVERPELRGVLHWTDAGVASWYDFAVAIQEEAQALGLLDRRVTVRATRSQDYPALARRPPFSVLDKSAGWAALGGPAPHWRTNLRQMLGELSRE